MRNKVAQFLNLDAATVLKVLTIALPLTFYFGKLEMRVSALEVQNAQLMVKLEQIDAKLTQIHLTLTSEVAWQETIHNGRTVNVPR